MLMKDHGGRTLEERWRSEGELRRSTETLTDHVYIPDHKSELRSPTILWRCTTHGYQSCELDNVTPRMQVIFSCFSYPSRPHTSLTGRFRHLSKHPADPTTLRLNGVSGSLPLCLFTARPRA
jgi:hypothetical protein